MISTLWTDLNKHIFQNDFHLNNVIQIQIIWVCFALFAFLVSRDCCVALPHDTTGLSAVCDCGIS